MTQALVSRSDVQRAKVELDRMRGSLTKWLKYRTLNDAVLEGKAPTKKPVAFARSVIEQSRDMMLAALDNKDGAARDIVALNAGASIYIAGKASTLVEGVQQALAVLASGAARKKLDQFVSFTQSHG